MRLWRTNIGILAFGALAVSASGQKAPARPVEGIAVIESVKIQKDQSVPGFVPVEVRLRNVSQHDIYGIRLDLTAQYTDGSTRPEVLGTDLLAGYLPRGEHEVGPQSAQLATFRSGETWQGRAEVHLGPDGAPPVGVQCQVTMVAFEDGTAIGSSEAIERLTQMRNAELDLHANLLSDFKAVAAASDPIQGAERRTKQILAEAAANNDKHVLRSGPTTGTTSISWRAQHLEGVVASARGNAEILKVIVADRVALEEAWVKALRNQPTLKEKAQ